MGMPTCSGSAPQTDSDTAGASDFPRPSLRFCIAVSSKYFTSLRVCRAVFAVNLLLVAIVAFRFGNGTIGILGACFFLAAGTAMCGFSMSETVRMRIAVHSIWLSHIDRAETYAEREELIDGYWDFMLKAQSSFSPFAWTRRRFSERDSETED